ncbi:MAG: NAD(P)-dependent alcohol dehydrogenase [Actinomycetota bacterium]
MKAIVQDRFGSADVLEFRDIPEPVPGPGEVRIQVRAAGIGPDVWHLMTGQPKFARLMPDFKKLWKGHPRGRDAAGIVESVGEGVTDLALGDEVMGIVEGSLADLAVGARATLVRKPARLSFEQAAAAPISGITALMAIRDVAKVQPGQRVLVVGAGGGVGTLAVQIAKAYGAEVTGVASGAKRDLVASLGADDFVDYTRQDFTDGARHWDVIVDTAGRRPLHRLRRALTPKGVVAIVGGDGGGDWTGGFFRQILRGPVLSLVSGQSFRPVISAEKPADLRALAELIESGMVTPVVGRTFALPDAPEALRYLEEGHPAGKVVVTV